MANKFVLWWTSLAVKHQRRNILVGLVILIAGFFLHQGIQAAFELYLSAVLTSSSRGAVMLTMYLAAYASLAAGLVLAGFFRKQGVDLMLSEMGPTNKEVFAFRILEHAQVERKALGMPNGVKFLQKQMVSLLQDDSSNGNGNGNGGGVTQTRRMTLEETKRLQNNPTN